MGGDLSIANNLLANNVQLNLDNNQKSLDTLTTQLSSGLRINSAADDPSGLAIATSLQTQVLNVQQATQNVQTANNAAQLTDAALASTTEILQRISSLAVEASSDINSNADRANLQAEVTQLLLEVNRISQNTNFNGQALLDGSHSGFQPEVNATISVTANASLASNGNLPAVAGMNYGLLAATAIASNVGFFNTTPSATSPGVQGLGGNSTVDGTIELQVVNTGVSIAVQETFIESATGLICVSGTLFGPNAANTSQRKITANGTSSLSGFDNVAITLGAITSADVGTTAYIKVSQNVAALTNPDNPAFNFQSGANEGDVIEVGIQATNTQTLRISNINLAISAAGNPSLGSEDAIGQVANALNQLLTQRAQLGAVVIRLNEDADSNNTAAVDLQASESQIRDINVGEASTEFTKLQVLVQLGTSVLAQANANAQTVLGLFR